MEVRKRDSGYPAKETAQTTGSEIQTLSKEEILKIDAEVLDGMGSLNRGRLTKAAPESLTLRQMQAAGAEFLAGLVAHPSIRKGLLKLPSRILLRFSRLPPLSAPKRFILKRRSIIPWSLFPLNRPRRSGKSR